MHGFLGFDIGGTKTAWGLVSREGKLLQNGRFTTPDSRSELIKQMADVAAQQKPLGIGIGIAGTLTGNKRSTLICTNMPHFNQWNLVDDLEAALTSKVPVLLDNDARCALIGEVWLGAASQMSSAVLITVGTGVGGAVMQKGRILPHPDDISYEVSRIVADPADVFPATSGQGTVEALIGGRNLEQRFDISLADMAQRVRKGDKEAVEVWQDISYFFLEVVKAIHAEYACKNIIVGGIGASDLKYYLQDEPPCQVVAAKLGEEAALYGAARLAIDVYLDKEEREEQETKEWS